MKNVLYGTVGAGVFVVVNTLIAAAAACDEVVENYKDTVKEFGGFTKGLVSVGQEVCQEVQSTVEEFVKR